MYKVNDLSKASDIPAHVVRYYVRIGIIQATAREGNGYQLFAKHDVAKLKFIRISRQIGLTLREIDFVLRHADFSATPCPTAQEIICAKVMQFRPTLDRTLKTLSKMEKSIEKWKLLPAGAPNGMNLCEMIDEINCE